MYRDTGGVDLNKTGISKESTILITLPGCADIGSHCHSRKEEDISIATRCQYHSVGTVSLKLTGDHIAGDNTTCFPVHLDQVIHLHTGIHLNISLFHLPAQGLVSTQQKLLSCLATGIKGT